MGITATHPPHTTHPHIAVKTKVTTTKTAAVAAEGIPPHPRRLASLKVTVKRSTTITAAVTNQNPRPPRRPQRTKSRSIGVLLQIREAARKVRGKFSRDRTVSSDKTLLPMTKKKRKRSRRNERGKA